MRPSICNRAPDLVVVGNALSRGNPAIEYMLDARTALRLRSAMAGRQRACAARSVLAVAGTHGKTTTTSLLAHLLEAGGRDPGFLVGGVPGNFGVSARLGDTHAPFVIEADEYDTAFFDKRSQVRALPADASRSSTISNTTTPTFSPTSPRSSASSIIWCAPCPATAG